MAIILKCRCERQSIKHNGEHNDHILRDTSLPFLSRFSAIAFFACTTLSAPSFAVAAKQFLPLPEQARPVDIPVAGYQMKREGKNAYVVLAGFVQATFVVTRLVVWLLTLHLR